ncbi:MAG: transglutaminase domain-containing protein [Akkermansiaceae bacterium]
MKSLSSAIFKLLFLTAIGWAGYELHPTLFPQNTVAEEPVSENLPDPKKQPQATQKQPQILPTKETTPNNIASKDKPTNKQTQKNHPAKPKNKPTPKEISPLTTATLILVGNQASSTAELKKDAELIEHAAYHGEWKQYRAMLKRSLSQAFSQSQSKLGRYQDRYTPLWNEPKYYTALLRWKMLGIFPNDVTSLTKSLAGSSDMMTWLLTHDHALEQVILTIHKNDNKKSAFKFLSKVWQNEVFTYLDEDEIFNQGDANDLDTLIPKYFNLALACSVVFDKNQPYKNKTSDSSNIDGFFRYHWYRKKSEAGLLEGDIHKASAKDLTFVVAAPVSKNELEWALSEYRSASRKHFGKAYSDVEYLMERAVSGLNPYAEYTLQEIIKEGGICGDQTFFCVNSARAAGIPAFGLSGLTNNGGHAWAAVKIEPDEWSTKIGRIAGVSKGKGKNPQTGENITEQEVWLWTQPKIASHTNTIKVHRNLWLADFLASNSNKPESHQAIKAAHHIGKEFPITWNRTYQVMLSQEELTATPALPATLAVWKDFVKDLKFEFRENPRMGSIATIIEDKHIFPYSDLAEVRRDLARLRRRDNRNAAEQADLMTTSLKREAQLILKRGKDDKDKALEEIHQLYSSALREYGGSISGFKEMIQYYFSLMKDDEDRAKPAVRTIELAFNRVVDTGSDNWFRKTTEVGIHRQIAKMYRQVGEETRATNMEKRLDRDMKNAERKAL